MFHSWKLKSPNETEAASWKQSIHCINFLISTIYKIAHQSPRTEYFDWLYKMALHPSFNYIKLKSKFLFSNSVWNLYNVVKPTHVVRPNPPRVYSVIIKFRVKSLHYLFKDNNDNTNPQSIHQSRTSCDVIVLLILFPNASALCV